MKSYARRSMCLWLTLFALCGSMLAAPPVKAAGPEGPSATESAPVTIDGTVLFRVFGQAIYPAKRRASEIAQRITALARDPEFDPKSLQVRDIEGLSEIYAGDRRVMLVLHEDAGLIGMLPDKLNLLAREVYLPQIVQAVKRYRLEREPATLRKNALHALLRTVMLVALLFVVFRSFRLLNRVLEKRFKKKIESLESKSKHIINSENIWGALNAVLRLLRAILVLGLIYIFVNFVLALFPWTRHVANTLLGYVLDPLRTMGQAFVDYLPNLFFLLLLFFVVRILLRLTRAFFSTVDRGALKLAGFHRDWAWPTYRIVRMAVIILALVLAYPYIPGSQSDAFKGISLLFGVLFSLGSTSLISNIIAGYTMTYRRAFKVGDRVKIGSNVGEVTNIRLLVTHMQSLKNEEIVLPNSAILAGEIVNFSTLAKERGLILHTEVGIGYEVPWRQVEAMLLLAAEGTPGLMKQPAPFVLQKALGDFAVTYELNAYCREPDRMAQLYCELHRNIQDVFNDYDVQIMTPHYVGDTPEPKVVGRDNWHAPPAGQLQEAGRPSADEA